MRGDPRIEFLDAAAHHEGHDLLVGYFRSGSRADAPAVPQHGEAIGQRADLFQEMRDINDAQTLRLEAAHEGKKMRDVVARQAARGFIQDQHARAHRDGAGDFHELPLGDGEPADARFGPDVLAPELRHAGGHGAALHFGPFHEWARDRLHAEHDVFHHGEMHGQRKLLIDHGYARAARVEGMRRPIGRAAEPHAAFVRRMRAGKHFHERALAGAVFADQREHFAGTDGEIHAVERQSRAEAFAHAFHAQKILALPAEECPKLAFSGA